MTLLRNFICLTALAATLFSCSKELSSEDNQAPSVIVDANWEFTESGIRYAGDIDTTYISPQTGVNYLTLEGSDTSAKIGQIILQVANTTLTTGTYTAPNINFQYFENGAIVFQSDPSTQNFSITISKIDSQSVTGIFAGVVRDVQGNERTITNGKFTGSLGGSLDSLPDPPGPDPNLDYFPMGQKWNYGNVDDPSGDTLSITVTGDTVIDSKTYTIFANDRTGVHRYYRKEGNNYIEYTQFNVTIPVPGAPALDLIVLKDDQPTGAYWETDPYSVTLSGITINAKLRNTITNRDFSSDINGTRYDNLIEVTTELYVQDSNGNFAPNGSYYTTLYAKGVGVVYYYDVNDESQWIIRSYLL